MYKKFITSFREIYGDTIEMKVLEYCLEYGSLDFAAGDLAKEINVSRPKVYEIISIFLKKGYLTKSRIVGRTQLFALNRNNCIIKIHLRNFAECLSSIIDEHSKQNNIRLVSSSKNSTAIKNI